MFRIDRRDAATTLWSHFYRDSYDPATPPPLHPATENSVQLLVSDHIRVVGWESINPNDQA